MTESQLLIGSKSFISSARAAQLVGYTKDYVGQLARAGKIESKLIGRSWYVSEDAVRQHKLTVHYTLTKPKKPRDVEKSAEIITSEKTTENIDKSPQVSKVNRQPTSYSEIEIGAFPDSSEPEQVDLYPVVEKKKHNDPLLRSDIYYESEGVLENNQELYPIREVTGDVIKKSSQNATFVPIHKKQRIIEKEATKHYPGTVGFMNQNHDRFQHNQISFDGVVPMLKKHTKDNNTNRYEDRNEYENEYQVNDDRDADYSTEYQQRSSRLYPILGAVVIFLVLALTYLIF